MQTSPTPTSHARANNPVKSVRSSTRWPKHPRGFKEVPVHWVGYQSGKQRFPRRDAQNNQLPRVSPLNNWRNNLTALSQYSNLYILAYNDFLHVYRFKFSDQALPKEPILKLKLPVSKPGLNGHMPPTPFIPYSTHAVNHLIISDFGDTEIVVCACDDGDVLAYRTDAFLGSNKPRPFFHYNVGKSAWGLAVHKEARMIAVSSNSHDVTVFAPALATKAPQSSSPSSSPGSPNKSERLPVRLVEQYSDWTLLRNANDPQANFYSNHHELTPALIHYRHLNLRRRLSHHDNNIPSVAFCNTPDDESGRFLASTDIGGTIVIWDTHDGIPIRTVKHTVTQSNHPIFEDYDPSRSGWGLLFLDRNCFSRTKSIVQATGICNKVSMRQHPFQSFPSVQIYDISQSQSNVQKASPRWHLGWNLPGNLEQSPSPPVPPSTTPNEPPPPGLFLEMDSEDEFPQAEDMYLIAGEDPFEDTIASRLDRGPISGQRFDSFQQNLHGRIHEDRLGSENAIGNLGTRKWSMLSHIPEALDTSSEPPSTPLLFLHPHKIHLFQSAAMNWYNVSDTFPPSPLVMLDDPLEQAVASEVRRELAQCDRMNLYVHIPDLGVVLVGSPKGRVAVLSLHLLEPDVEPMNGLSRTDIDSPMYTMRLDYILPFAREEAEGKRPVQRLVGLAAGPSHGGRNRDKSKYRIMLTYQNHAVLSYEIGREGSDNQQDVKLL